MDLTYTFYAGAPYFLKGGRMEETRAQADRKQQRATTSRIRLGSAAASSTGSP